MSRLPNPNRPEWQLRLPIIGALAAALVAVVGGSVAFWKAWRDAGAGEPVVITILVGVVLFAIVLKEALQLYRSVEDVRRQRRHEEMRDLSAVCHVLRQQLSNLLPEEKADPEAVRVTVYRVIHVGGDDGVTLERVVGYAVGERGRSGGAGKRLSGRCGIVGMAARTGEAQCAVRQHQDAADFRDQMIKEWGFHEAEARLLDTTRWSWMAIPITGSDGSVDTILYVDSSEAALFTEQVREEFVYSTVEALSRIIEMHYGK